MFFSLSLFSQTNKEKSIADLSNRQRIVTEEDIKIINKDIKFFYL